MLPALIILSLISLLVATEADPSGTPAESPAEPPLRPTRKARPAESPKGDRLAA